MSIAKDTIMDILYTYQDSLLKMVSSQFHRYLYHEIDWTLRMIGIRGQRGVGKSTLVLQYIKENKLHQDGNGLYITMDHPYFYQHSLFDTIHEFYKIGGRYIFIDEIHKYPRWSNELKVIYDGHPDLKIVFTSSSALEIFKGSADLSRRVILYDMHGLSFREYINLTETTELTTIDWPSISSHPQPFIEQIKTDSPILRLFQEYLQVGYFPMISEYDPKQIPIFLNQIINTVIDSDLSHIKDYSSGTAQKIKKLIGVIAESVPFKPNISALAHKLEASRDSVYTWLHDLEQGKLINTLRTKGKGVATLQKPDKIYLENTNLIYALRPHNEMGNIRETFLLNQLINSGLSVSLPKSGDFFVNGKAIEVGGKNKSSKQVSSYSDFLVAKDNTLSAYKNSAPLWLFGFLY